MNAQRFCPIRLEYGKNGTEEADTMAARQLAARPRPAPAVRSILTLSFNYAS
jgi:hypothetical protein